MSKSSYLPPSDGKQGIRIERFLMSVGFYVLCIVPVGLSVYLNLLPLHVMLTWMLLSVIGNVIIYIAMRLNLNLLLKDPSFTIPQMVLAIGLVLYLQIYAGQLRGGYLLALMLAFAFGCFKLKSAQLLWLTALTILAYICTMPLIKDYDGAHFNPFVELTLLITFAIFMPSLAILTGSFNNLRKQLQIANQKLMDLNHFDGLTGVGNRAYFNEKYELEWHRSQRTNNAIGLLMVDIDHFKFINDTYGHLGGDVCLIRVANIIKEVAQRQTDNTFRYGGEEFIILLAATDTEGAIHIAESIRAQIAAAEIIFDGKEIPVTVSIGVATMVLDFKNTYTSDALIINADTALYQAKRSGRNRVCIFAEPSVPCEEIRAG